MYLNEKGTFTWQGVHEYSDLTNARFHGKLGDAVPEAGRETLNAWRNAAQEAYELQKQRGEVKSRIVVNGVAGAGNRCTRLSARRPDRISGAGRYTWRTRERRAIAWPR
jgi:hypothetical protein